MDKLVIKSEREVSLTFHSRRFNAESWLEHYCITANARNFNASIEVENPPYGMSPAEFFERIAAEWSGWKGAKEWGAIEGEYNLSATCDSLGHITLEVEINRNGYPLCWPGILSLIIEAGQLEKLARDAKAFFNEAA